jgi:nitrite reductase (NADH) large subunit
MSTLVVGGGIAGQAVLEAIREHDRHEALTLVSAEPRLPYDRVALSTLLASGADPDTLTLRPASWYEDQRVEVRLGEWVETVDPALYDRVVLCTGSDALVPPIPGAEGAQVFRGPEDCAALAAHAGGRAVVIGGGLLGLEAAYGLASLGCSVTVVHLMDRLMERQLDGGAAALLAPAMQALGVEVLLERNTRRITPHGVELEDSFVEADLVVISVGIRPQVALARALGLEVNRGIVVDDFLATSRPGVFAVGECAEHRGIVHGIVAPIHEQARALAAGEPYTGTIPTAKLKVMGVDLVCAGSPEGARAVVVNDERTYRKLAVDASGRTVGTILLGDTRGAELLMDAVRTAREANDPLALLAEASQATAGDLPDSARVCNCHGVCKGDIVDAIRTGGLGSTLEVVNVTRAGAGCGSCRPLVGELLAIERGGAAEEATYLCPCRRQTRGELAAVVRERGLESVSELSEACGAGRDCGACKPGLAYLVSEVCGNRHREERHARFINDRVHANIQNDGTFSVVPRIRGGVTTADELRRIADVADRHEVPLIKITGGQRIDLLGIRKEQLPAIWEELDMPSGHAYAKAVRTVKTCVGTDFCRFGLGDAMGVGIELERAMEGLYTPHKVKSAVTGCPRNCAEAYVKDIGLVAVEGGWELYVGGAAGATVRKGDLLATVPSSEEAIRLSLAFLQHYRENADYLERTYGYLERVGIEFVREAVLSDIDGLLERYRIAKAAADPDPWRERHAPVHHRQFAELDS